MYQIITSEIPFLTIPYIHLLRIEPPGIPRDSLLVNGRCYFHSIDNGNILLSSARSADRSSPSLPLQGLGIVSVATFVHTLEELQQQFLLVFDGLDVPQNMIV